jgi:hypothetical protein
VQSALSDIDIVVPHDWNVVCDVDAVWGGIGTERFPPILQHLETSLDPRQLARVHRSFILNVALLARLEPWVRAAKWLCSRTAERCR